LEQERAHEQAQKEQAQQLSPLGETVAGCQQKRYTNLQQQRNKTVKQPLPPLGEKEAGCQQERQTNLQQQRKKTVKQPLPQEPRCVDGQPAARKTQGRPGLPKLHRPLPPLEETVAG
jgi:hypothetical protein